MQCGISLLLPTLDIFSIPLFEMNEFVSSDPPAPCGDFISGSELTCDNCTHMLSNHGMLRRVAGGEKLPSVFLGGDTFTFDV